MVWATTIGYTTSPAGCRVSGYLGHIIMFFVVCTLLSVRLSTVRLHALISTVWHTHWSEELEVRILGGCQKKWASSSHFTSVAFNKCVVSINCTLVFCFCFFTYVVLKITNEYYSRDHDVVMSEEKCYSASKCLASIFIWFKIQEVPSSWTFWSWGLALMIQKTCQSSPPPVLFLWWEITFR